jgi:hypothetical protein
MRRSLLLSGLPRCATKYDGGIGGKHRNRAGAGAKVLFCAEVTLLGKGGAFENACCRPEVAGT